MGATSRGPTRRLWPLFASLPPLFLVTFTLLFVRTADGATSALQKANYEVFCRDDRMIIEVTLGDARSVHLDKYDVLPACQPQRKDKMMIFEIPYKGKCGVNRVERTDTGEVLYYHRLVTEEKDGASVSLVKCLFDANGNEEGSHGRLKRQIVDELPEGFSEPPTVEITKTLVNSAPVPELNVAIRQNGELVGEQRPVRPGSPLTMEVFLDQISKSIYGLEVKQLDVTDARSKQEVLVLNSCSVDTHLFEDFKQEGDYLRAKFRAFKFPETTYVEFKGTVDVCLAKCPGELCANRLLGFGRRRRSTDPNALFRVAVSTVIQVDEEGIPLRQGRLASEYVPAKSERSVQDVQMSVPETVPVQEKESADQEPEPDPEPEHEPEHEHHEGHHHHHEEGEHAAHEHPESAAETASEGTSPLGTTLATLLLSGTALLLR